MKVVVSNYDYEIHPTLAGNNHAKRGRTSESPRQVINTQNTSHAKLLNANVAVSLVSRALTYNATGTLNKISVTGTTIDEFGI
jgi:hypothetical protein